MKELDILRFARCSFFLLNKTEQKMHQTDLVIICVTVGVAFGILLASCAFIAVRFYRKRSYHVNHSNENGVTSLPIRANGIGISMESCVSLSHSNVFHGASRLDKKSTQWSWWSSSHDSKDALASASVIPSYSYKDIQKATHNFTTILGQGSFGPVYKAVMPTNEVVAVKVLASNSRQGEKEFQTEDTFIIAAQAVPPVIHRDLKSANILLDRCMRAKAFNSILRGLREKFKLFTSWPHDGLVADFGLSKEESYDGRRSGLKGTYGYIDPEYLSTNKFTKKSDIYSFGIILLELITAINPQQGLLDYVNLAVMDGDGKGGWDEILDKQLVGKCDLEEVRLLASTAYRCAHKVPRKRPSIVDVSQAISRIQQGRMSLRPERGDMSRVVSRIEHQQMELSYMASIKERTHE
ncbi:hypothetical protein ACLOJK_031065 [Asimina triloba]